MLRRSQKRAVAKCLFRQRLNRPINSDVREFARDRSSACRLEQQVPNIAAYATGVTLWPDVINSQVLQLRMLSGVIRRQ